MTDTRTGRLLAACLHQAIADVLPQRLDFYENWLHSEGLRDGSIGLAPITAVVGFLRTEGVAYDAVVVRAGQLAADWSIASLASVPRRVITWLPRPLRARAALRLASRIIKGVDVSGRSSTRVRGNSARLEVKSSLFCTVRERQATPMCGFYLAVAISALNHFGIAAAGRVERCRAVEGSTCIMALELRSGEAAVGPAIAA